MVPARIEYYADPRTREQFADALATALLPALLRLEAAAPPEPAGRPARQATPAVARRSA